MTALANGAAPAPYVPPTAEQFYREATDRELLVAMNRKLDILGARLDAFEQLAESFAEIGSKGIPGILGALLKS